MQKWRDRHGKWPYCFDKRIRQIATLHEMHSTEVCKTSFLYANKIIFSLLKSWLIFTELKRALVLWGLKQKEHRAHKQNIAKNAKSYGIKIAAEKLWMKKILS